MKIPEQPITIEEKIELLSDLVKNVETAIERLKKRREEKEIYE